MAKGLSQEEIALRVGTVDQAYVSQLETGLRNPTGRTLYRLALALEAPAGEFFAVEGVPNEIAGTVGSVDFSTSKKARRAK